MPAPLHAVLRLPEEDRGLRAEPARLLPQQDEPGRPARAAHRGARQMHPRLLLLPLEIRNAHNHAGTDRSTRKKTVYVAHRPEKSTPLRSSSVLLPPLKLIVYFGGAPRMYPNVFAVHLHI